MMGRFGATNGKQTRPNNREILKQPKESKDSKTSANGAKLKN